jgi:hypothetical protein
MISRASTRLGREVSTLSTEARAPADTHIVAEAHGRAQATGEAQTTATPKPKPSCCCYSFRVHRGCPGAGLDRTTTLAAVDVAIDALRA